MAGQSHTGAFALDTSGTVRSSEPNAWETIDFAWDDLSPFTQGYIEAALHALDEQRMAYYQDRRRRGLPEAVPLRAAYHWLAPETLARIIADCEAIGAAPCAVGGKYPGKMFWRSRQNPEHAKGDAEGNRYWDTVADFPPQTVQLCDDGKVRFADAAIAKATGVER